VSHLVLVSAIAKGRRKRATTPDDLALADARTETVRAGWGKPDPQYRYLFVSKLLADGTAEEWRDFDELQRRSTSAENAWRLEREFGEIDITDIAPNVRAPTLIACGRNEPENFFFGETGRAWIDARQTSPQACSTAGSCAARRSSHLRRWRRLRSDGFRCGEGEVLHC
jgi:hypothetical protein